MKNNVFFPFLIVALLLSSFAFISGCGSSPAGGGGSSSSGRVYFGINSRGDTAKVTLTDKKFTLVLKHGPDIPLSISGTLTLDASGLLSCEVTYSSDTDKVATDEIANGIEITGEVLAMALTGNMIICPAHNTTQPQGCTVEAIMIAGMSWESDGKMAFATMEYTTSPILITNNLYQILGNYVDTDVLTKFAWSDHFFWDTNHPEIFVSPKGLFAGIRGSNINSSFVGVKHSGVAIADIIASGTKTYKGMSYSIDFPTSSGNTDIGAIVASTDASSDLIYVSNMDMTTGSADASGVFLIARLRNIDVIAPGIISGEAGDPGDPGFHADMIAYKYNDAGKIAMTGIASTDSNVTNFFLIEQ